MADRELVVLGTASQSPTRSRNHNGYLLLWDLAREWGHLTAGQAGRIAAEAEARLLVLTHFSQRYDHDDVQRLAAQAATTFGGLVVPAHDLDRIPVPSRQLPAT